MANIKISELNPLLTVQDADVIPIVDNAITKKVTAEILRGYTQGNSVLLTGAQTVAGIKTFTSQLASSVVTGTAPFSIASTTKVTNLNADLLDGLSSADFQATLSGSGIVKSTAGTISYLTDNSTNWNTAFNDKINSAAVTGSGTNTLTLTQQDAGTITATWVNGTLIREIRNNTGATLTKGTIVYISGATGNKPTVSKAIATGDSTSAQTFGFVQENIANNANGYVVVIGDLVGVDTSAFTEGDQLYLSSTVAGAFTSVKQYAPNHLVYVGIVTRAHPTLGQIEVNIQNGYELDELHNVAAQNPSNGDILQYVTSTGLWTKIAGTTSAISEGTNLYFTNARSRSAISLTTTGTSGAATYNSTTGVLNVPNYADTDTGITSLNGLTALTQTFAVGTSGTDFGISSATSTHTFNLPTASAVNRGALSSADWTTFNNKQNALTNPITGTGTTNYLPKFTGASALGNSLIYDSGTSIVIGGTNGFGWKTLINSAASGQNLLLASSTTGVSIGFNDLTSTIAPRINGIVNDLTFNTSSVERMRITSTGNIGIATTTPSGNLGIGVQTGLITTTGITLGSVNANIEFIGSAFGSGYGAKIYQNGERALSIAGRAGTTVWTDHFTVLDTGFVGIGTITPTFKLDVVGTARVSGAATFSSTLSTVGDATINGVKVGEGGGSIATNTAVGASALNVNTTGSANTAVGGNALASNITGANNTALGKDALFSNTASNNTAIGFEAAFTNASGTGVTAIGYRALKVSTGNNNTALGNSALASNTTAADNTAMGASALGTNTTGVSNTGIGLNALALNSVGSNNTAVGRGSLQNNTASNNTAVGFEAALTNTTGQYLTAIGYQALRVSTGDQNTAVGWQSLLVNTTGAKNTAVGQGSLYSNITGANNTAVGVNALGLNTASNNTAVGFEAANGNTSATGNTILGYQAAKANSTGANNSIIGFGQVCTNFSGVSMIGVSDTATAANQMRFGSATVNNGAVATEVLVSDRSWAVFINGVAYKILLKA